MYDEKGFVFGMGEHLWYLSFIVWYLRACFQTGSSHSLRLYTPADIFSFSAHNAPQSWS
jgi:hypothetical protein